MPQFGKKIRLIDPPPQPEERRRAPREAVNLAALLTLEEGRALPCVVTQISDSGLRLEVDAAIALPTSFDVSIPERYLFSHVQLIWRRENRAGVALVEEREKSAMPLSVEAALQRIKDLLADNAKLKTQVTALNERIGRLTDE